MNIFPRRYLYVDYPVLWSSPLRQQWLNGKVASSSCDLFSLNLLMTFRYCSSVSTLSSTASFWLNETSQRGIKRRTTCDRPQASQRPNLVKLGRNLARLLDVIIRGSPCGGRCLMHCKGAERGVAKHSCEDLWSRGESWRTETFRERWIMLLAYVLTPGSGTKHVFRWIMSFYCAT